MTSDAHFVNGVSIEVCMHIQLGVKCVICCVGVGTYCRSLIGYWYLDLLPVINWILVLGVTACY